jgi:hypothetical protein
MNAIVITTTVNASKFSEFNDPEITKPNSHNPADFDGSRALQGNAVFQR